MAAVIASFVFGMAGQVTKTKVVGFTVQKSATTNVTVTNMGGQDVGSLSAVNVTINNAEMATKPLLNVGQTATYAAADGVVAGRNHVMIIGSFTDSSTQQVLLDTYV